MGHLKYSGLVDISPFFNGSICQLFLVKGRKSLIVKSLKPEYCNIPALKSRFISEVEILQSLQTSNTLALIKSRVDIKRPYFAYEYIKGTNLDKILKAGTVSLSQSVDIIRQLLTILSNLHDRDGRLIHSDISPDNIILSKQGQVYLIDFGCACIPQQYNDAAHTWIGKHAYLSPEQAQGLQWTQQSDLYQVGLLFYEMLTGMRRNNANTTRDMLPLAANPPALELRGIDCHYHEFINRILSVDINKRYQTAHQALLELNNI